MKENGKTVNRMAEVSPEESMVPTWKPFSLTVRPKAVDSMFIQMDPITLVISRMVFSMERVNSSTNSTK